MAANSGAGASTRPAFLLNPDMQAKALARFVQARYPHFSVEAARRVVEGIGASPADTPKTLAKRLEPALRLQRVPISHTSALKAAAQVLGFSDWFSATQAPAAGRLVVSAFDGNDESTHESWHSAVGQMLEHCTAWLARTAGQPPVFRLQANERALTVWGPAPVGEPADHSWPVFNVVRADDYEHWLDEAGSALERFRRGLEERRLAVVDGLGVLTLCAWQGHIRMAQPWQSSWTLRGSDAANSELVLLQETESERADRRYEVGRGDELACWAGLEFASNGASVESVTIDEAVWRVDGTRYVWEMQTIGRLNGRPGLVIQQLNDQQVEDLLRRYRLAHQLLGPRLQRPSASRRLETLKPVTESCRLNLARTHEALAKAGYTWQTYCETEGIEQAVSEQVSFGFVLRMLERIKPVEPNLVFAPPAFDELTRASERLLNSLLPAIDKIRFTIESSVSEQAKAAARDAIEELGLGLTARLAERSGMIRDPEGPTPHYLHSDEAPAFLDSLAEHSLCAFLGLMPYVVPTRDTPLADTKAWSHALGQALYLRIRSEEQA